MKFHLHLIIARLGIISHHRVCCMLLTHFVGTLVGPIKHPRTSTPNSHIHSRERAIQCTANISCLSFRDVFHHSNLLNLAEMKSRSSFSTKIWVPHRLLFCFFCLCFVCSRLHAANSSSHHRYTELRSKTPSVRSLVNLIHFQVVFNEN